ncbi:protein PXR1 [Lycium barbarum]|uniref:protein PXR1 n=1 Tax=Lycium barbarum TaxID=112863 RepID=UPI00293E0502|nr:protein PXR1 [Lycium barbarum]
MPETEGTAKHDAATKTEDEEIYEKEKEDKHSDEDGKDDKDEKEGKDKKKKKKDKDEKNDEKDNKKNKKKDKKEKNSNDKKDIAKLKLKVEKIDAKMQDLEEKREVILELFNEAGKIAANASAARLPFDPLSSHLTKKKKKAK